MRRPLSTAAVALAATAGVLAVAGPAVAEGGLVPGATQDLPVVLDTRGWDEVPDRLEVAVSGLTQGENGCLEPEREAGDGCGAEGVDPGSDPGELAGQLNTTVAAGRLEDGQCVPLGEAASLPLVPAVGDLDGAVLTVDDAASWDDVDCLDLALTFTDGEDNNLAQSDTVDFDLEVYASSSAPEDGGTVTPDDGATGGTPNGGTTGGTPDGGATGGPTVGTTDSGATGGIPDGGATGGTPPGGDVGVAPGTGGPSAAGLGTGGGRGAPAGGAVPAGPAAPVELGAPSAPGDVIGRSTASVTVDADGATARTVTRTQTETRAAGQSLGPAVIWAGGAFVAALALGWFLFLAVRRRRRTESAA